MYKCQTICANQMPSTLLLLNLCQTSSVSYIMVTSDSVCKYLVKINLHVRTSVCGSNCFNPELCKSPLCKYLHDKRQSFKLRITAATSFWSSSHYCGYRNWSLCFHFNGFLLVWSLNFRAKYKAVQKKAHALWFWGNDTKIWQLMLMFPETFSAIKLELWQL